MTSSSRVSRTKPVLVRLTEEEHVQAMRIAQSRAVSLASLFRTALQDGAVPLPLPPSPRAATWESELAAVASRRGVPSEELLEQAVRRLLADAARRR